MSCICIGIVPDDIEYYDKTIVLGDVKGIPWFVPRFAIDELDLTPLCDELMKRDLAETICGHFGIPERADDLYAVIDDRDGRDREEMLKEKGITPDILPYITGRTHRGAFCITDASFLHDFIMRLAVYAGYSIISHDIGDLSENSTICLGSEEEAIRLAESMGMTEDQLVSMFDSGICAAR